MYSLLYSELYTFLYVQGVLGVVFLVVKLVRHAVLRYRAGHEGRFPDLERKAEEKLAELNPNSRALRKEVPLGTMLDLDKDEQKTVTEEMDDWMASMKQTEERFGAGGEDDEFDDPTLPPVRGTSASIPVSKKSENKENLPKKRVKPRDYKEWDKVDVEAELAKVDSGETIKKENKNVLKNPNAPSIPEKVDTLGLTEEEKCAKAEREKDKGNEAFRSGDFEEALLYYTRSINLIPTVAAQNNRAQTYIKLKKWDSALSDCNAVLKPEPNNLKAVLRRAVALQGKGEFVQAATDIKHVLDVDPNNKRAVDLLTDIEKALAEQKVKGRRLVIDESDSDSDNLDKVQLADEGSAKPVSNGSVHADIEEDLQRKVSGLTKGKTKDSKPKVVLCDEDSDTDTDTSAYTSAESGKSNSSAEEGKATQSANSENVIPHQQDSNTKPEISKSEVKSAETETNSKSKVSTEEARKSLAADLIQLAEATANVQPKEPCPPQPKEPTPPPVQALTLPPQVNALKDSGTELFRNGQYAEAIIKYSKAIDKLPDSLGHAANMSVLYSNRAACLSKTGDLEGCVKDCNQALLLSPTALKPRMRRAQAYETMEKYRKAYVEYRQILRMDHSVEMANAGVNRCSKTLQQQDGAQWRDKLPVMPGLVTMPNFTPTAASVTYPDKPAIKDREKTQTKTTKTEQKKTEVKSPKAEKKTSHEHSAPDPQAALEEMFAKFKAEGNNFVKKGQYEAAVQAYSRCTDCCPEEVASFTNRALCYLKLNKPANVIDDCDTAISLDSENVKALFRRAQAHKMMKNYDESIQDLKRLLSLDRNNTAAKKEFESVLRLKQQEMVEKKQKEASKKQPLNPKPAEKASRRMKIEEVESSDDDQDKISGKPAAEHKPAKTTSNPSKKVEEMKTPEQPSQPSKKSKKKKSKGNKQDPQEGATTSGFNMTTSKVKTSGSKIKDTAMDAPRLSKATPYEFMAAWMALKTTDSAAAYAQLLEQVKPEELPTVISNKLEGDMLTTISKCVDLIVEKGELDKGFSYLQHLTRVPRFQMVSMFLSDSDKKEILSVFDKLHARGTICPNALKKLKKEYGL